MENYAGFWSQSSAFYDSDRIVLDSECKVSAKVVSKQENHPSKQHFRKIYRYILQKSTIFAQELKLESLMKKKNFRFLKVDYSNWYKYHSNPQPTEFWYGQCDTDHPFDEDGYIRDENREIIYIGGDLDREDYIDAPYVDPIDPDTLAINLPDEYYKSPEHQLAGEMTLKVKEVDDVNGLYGIFWATTICLRSKGVSLETLKNLVYNSYRYTKEHGMISPVIHIDKDCRVFLKNDKITEHQMLGEIELDPATKALYILFLRHPEGLNKNQLPGYIKEMSEIYKHITNTEQLSEKSIKAIKNMLGQKDKPAKTFAPAVKRIKDEFLKYVEDDIARECYIRVRPHTTKYFIQLMRYRVTVE